jgi:hypothetical protein
MGQKASNVADTYQEEDYDKLDRAGRHQDYYEPSEWTQGNEIPKPQKPHTYVTYTKKKFIPSTETVIGFIDLDFIFDEPKTEKITRVGDLEHFVEQFHQLSLHIRTHPKLSEPIRFVVDPSIANFFKTDLDDTRLCDNGSGQWLTARFSFDMTSGNSYYVELVLESINNNKFLMIGGVRPELYTNMLKNCLGTRFYASGNNDVQVGSTLGFVWNFKDNDRGLYVIIDGVPKGRSCMLPIGDVIVPVICLACGGNTLRINTGAPFPECNWKQ